MQNIMFIVKTILKNCCRHAQLLALFGSDINQIVAVAVHADAREGIIARGKSGGIISRYA